MKLSTHGRSGQFDRSIEVDSNDPEKPKFELKLTGQIEVVAAFEPASLYWEKVGRGATKTDVVKVKAKDPAGFRITDVNSTEPALKAEFTRVDGSPALRLTFTAPDKVGPVSASITATTNLDNVKKMQLYVRGQVTEDLNADTQLVFVPPYDEKTPSKAEIHVDSLAGKPFKVKSVTLSQDIVTAKAERVDARWFITLTAKKDVKTGEGKVTIATDRKDQPTIEVAFRVTAEKPLSRSPILFNRGDALRRPAALRGLK